MEKVKFDQGGQPINLDDLIIMQDSVFTILNAQFTGLGDFVFSGVTVTGSNTNATLSAGLVRINNKIMQYLGTLAGALNFQNFPYYYLVEGNTVDFRPKSFASGDTKNTRTTTYAILTPTQPNSGGYIRVEYNNNIFRLKDAFANSFIRRGVIWDVCINPTPNLEVDTTGLGINTWIGWAICNGQNGTPDLRKRFRVGADFSSADYNVVGNTGGEEFVKLTNSQTPLPNHKHNISNYAEETLSAPYLQGTGQTPWRAFVKQNNGKETEQSTDNRTIQSHENRPPYLVVVPMMKL
jgi:hypothetical protein